MEVDMYFLARNPLFETEKPYTMKYPPRTKIPQTNVQRVVEKITVNDMRCFDSIAGPTFNTHGFEKLKFESSMSYEDFENRDKVDSTHAAEISEAVRQRFGATHVHAIDTIVGQLPRS